MGGIQFSLLRNLSSDYSSKKSEHFNWDENYLGNNKNYKKNELKNKELFILKNPETLKTRSFLTFQWDLWLAGLGLCGDQKMCGILHFARLPFIIIIIF